MVAKKKKLYQHAHIMLVLQFENAKDTPPNPRHYHKKYVQKLKREKCPSYYILSSDIVTRPSAPKPAWADPYMYLGIYT